MLDNDSIQIKRNRNGMYVKESNLFCPYPHIMVIDFSKLYAMQTFWYLIHDNCKSKTDTSPVFWQTSWYFSVKANAIGWIDIKMSA